jgi:hypothetical protein
VKHYLSRSLASYDANTIPRKGEKGTVLTNNDIQRLIILLVVVGMSGVVDSSVAARLLADQVRKDDLLQSNVLKKTVG